MIDLQNATSADLAWCGLQSARKRRYANYRDAMFFARHSRSTSLAEIKAMPLPEFRSYLQQLHLLLEVEWESPEI